MGTRILLFLISSSPSEQPRSSARTANASSVMAALSSINSSTRRGTAPATTTASLFALYTARLKIAVAASFLPAGVPSFRSPTSAGIALGRAPIATLQSSIMDRLNIAAAAFFLASMVLPDSRTPMTLSMAPAAMIRSLLLLKMERLSSAVTAFSWILGS
ncbi:hypothetical protein PanWU01x14_015110 [Parasponia andersonii]|uniref:Uncharacterized protein n=1 Tax=Parasponia andersonii TaxID=3476 RepID=A0A2P5E0E6_PARAD|nr:hypothetical protein PanWU01x14_015110 [Parasponia andersonii]